MTDRDRIHGIWTAPNEHAQLADQRTDGRLGDTVVLSSSMTSYTEQRNLPQSATAVEQG
jgi:hypothetical protein